MKKYFILGVAVTPMVTMGQYFPISKSSLNNATVNVRVVDENANPIQGVRSDYYSLSDDDSLLGLSDTNGIYTVNLKQIYSQISGHFTKCGYYKTSGVFWKWDKWGGVPPADTNFTIVMKRIINPVQLKNNDITTFFPRIDEPVGFDLEIGDWVLPDGKGKISDIILSLEGVFVTNYNYSFQMKGKFVGELNGIQPFTYPKVEASRRIRSELPPPSVAPLFGYDNTFERYTKQTDKSVWSRSYSYNEEQKWFFRIRTVVDENGEIVSANYGWMYDDIVFGPSPKDIIFRLKYYYNPDPHSRSLEPKEIADRQNK